MKIIEKIRAKSKDLYGQPPVAIAFLGDSVTHGCFDVYRAGEKEIGTYFDIKNGYHAQLIRAINTLYPNVPVNLINGGSNGGSAPEGLERLERDVLRFSPDLCVVCFGLNDANRNVPEAEEEYLSSIREIFAQLQSRDTEVIFMTPNMSCTEVSCHIHDEFIREVAGMIADNQNNGVLERFLEGAKRIAEEMNIPVCDCYAKWKMLYDNDVNITELLSNHINHPTVEMDQMFVTGLLETMFTK